MQRFSAGGDRVWLRPVAVSAGGPTTLAADAWDGCYLVGASGDGLRVQHVAADGTIVGDAGRQRCCTWASPTPGVEGVSWNAAGDLAVAYGDGAASAGVARMTYLGAWSSPALSPAPSGARRPRRRRRGRRVRPRRGRKAPGCGGSAKPGPR